MSNEEKLVEELVKNALYRLDESTRMIEKSLAHITEEQLWQKPNPTLNSIGNLILHLCGNITQYVISSLGETPDTRHRDAEFAADNTLNKVDLLHQLTETVDTAKRVIFDAGTAKFLKQRSVQGFSLSGIGVVMHAVEHYSYHTGQIAFWVKQLHTIDLGFYEGMDLDVKSPLAPKGGI